MRRVQLRDVAVLAVSLAAVGFGVRASARAVAEEMAAAANGFLAALTEEQRSRATFPFESDERLNWHFIPTEMHARQGIQLNDLNEAQRQAAHALLRTGLSARGYTTATAIIALEEVLRELEQRGQFVRDPGRYFISVFGTPSADGTWGWRFEGHHLSLHFTVVGGKTTVSTPSFFGSNPAEVRQGPRTGERVLGAQEDAGRALAQALTAEQRATAVIADAAPRDIVTGNRLPVEPLSPSGIAASSLTPEQQRLLRAVVESYTSLMTDAVAAERWARIDRAGFDRVTFAWVGSVERGAPHYFRVQGPTFLIEFDNTQNGANHVHSVWRDFEGDFGRDLLREHLGMVPH